MPVPGLLLLALSATLAPALLGGTARAHGIQSSLERVSLLGAQLESSFSSGQPASHAAVRLVPPQGLPIAVGQTDAEGRLRFQLPPEAGSDWELQVDAGPGHRDYLELPAASGPAPATGPAPVSRRPGFRPGWSSGLLAVGALGGLGLLGGLLRQRFRG